MLTALEKLPADRFATAAEFAEALQDKRYASTASLPAAAAPAAARRRARRRRGPGVLVPALGAALAVADGRGALGLAPARRRRRR